MRAMPLCCVLFSYFLSACTSLFAANVIPAVCEVADEGLKVTQSFSDDFREGDTITHAEGVKITPTNAEGLWKRLTKTNKYLSLSVRRGKETLELKVKLVAPHELSAAREKREKEREAQRAARQKEELASWLSKTVFKDKRGREWTAAEIDDFNKDIEANVTRMAFKYDDAEKDRKAEILNDSKESSIGFLIRLGFEYTRTIKETLQLADGQSLQGIGGQSRWSSLEEWARLPNHQWATVMRTFEALFDYSDGGRFMIPCRDGTVITAEDAWNRVVLLKGR